jgi:hypothetical protein
MTFLRKLFRVLNFFSTKIRRKKREVNSALGVLTSSFIPLARSFAAAENFNAADFSMSLPAPKSLPFSFRT